MFFYLSKILKILLFPTTWIIVLLITAGFTRRKGLRLWSLWISIALLVIFSNKQLLLSAQYLSTRDYSSQSLPQRHYTVAVVMGGFGGMNSATGQMTYVDDRGERLWEAIRLWHSGAVDKLLVTGDESSAIHADGTSTAEPWLDFMATLGVPDSCILLEQHARNTRENATLSIAILDSIGIADTECLLITSASHMKRSLSCFEHEGHKLTPYATNIYPRPALHWKNFLPAWKVLIQWQELINEWAGSLVYNIVGY